MCKLTTIRVLLTICLFTSVCFINNLPAAEENKDAAYAAFKTELNELCNKLDDALLEGSDEAEALKSMLANVIRIENDYIAAANQSQPDETKLNELSQEYENSHAFMYASRAMYYKKTAEAYNKMVRKVQSKAKEFEAQVINDPKYQVWKRVTQLGTEFNAPLVGVESRLQALNAAAKKCFKAKGLNNTNMHSASPSVIDATLLEASRSLLQQKVVEAKKEKEGKPTNSK